MGTVVSLVPRLTPLSQRTARLRAREATRQKLERARETSARSVERSALGALMCSGVAVALYALLRGFEAMPWWLSLSLSALVLAGVIVGASVVGSWVSGAIEGRPRQVSWRDSRRPSAPAVHPCHKVIAPPRADATRGSARGLRT